MKLVVPIQFVPDLVEELVIDAQGNRLDPDYLRWILNEFDDHAIEQAVLLKEKYGASVTVLAPDFEGADDVLYAAAARGADKLVKVYADFEAGFNTHALTRIYEPILRNIQPDLVLTGVQAHSSMDGSLGPQLAGALGWPFCGYVSCVTIENIQAIARKDYPGGLTAEMAIELPAVLGIAAAETAPRYVPISRIRQAMKTCQIDEEEPGELDLEGGPAVYKMYPPTSGDKAQMLEGTAEQIADQLVEIFKSQGIL
jgi:electron transfer flavoprotein beta subunit